MKKILLLMFSILCVNSFSYVERNDQVGNRGLELIRESNINQNMGLSKESGSTQIIDAYRGNGKFAKTKGFMIALISLIALSIFNAFMRVGMLEWVITIGGVVIFTGLIAYDVNRIKAISYQLADGDNEAMEKMSIDGAFSLYLDFINLFFYLLRIFGRKK